MYLSYSTIYTTKIKEIYKMNSSEIIVSVYSKVYNHEPYIRSALEGFISQKTNFKFEVIVHDDASTDNSAKIIKEYAEKYPDIIKPIFQTENQYSKKISILKTFIIPKIKGKYVATCEGDDYWISCHKLQKQVDFLEHNPDYVACTHNTIMLKKKIFFYKKRMFSKGDRDLYISSFLKSGYHTSSLMYRREYLFNRPDFTTKQPGVGDFPLAIYLALSGKIKFFDENMSLYRYSTPGSWSSEQKNDLGKQILNTKNAINMLKAANEWSEYQHDKPIKDIILYLEFINLLKLGKFEDIKKEPYIKIWEKESIKNKIKFILKYQLKMKLHI